VLGQRRDTGGEVVERESVLEPAAVELVGVRLERERTMQLRGRRMHEPELDPVVVPTLRQVAQPKPQPELDHLLALEMLEQAQALAQVPSRQLRGRLAHTAMRQGNGQRPTLDDGDLALRPHAQQVPCKALPGEAPADDRHLVRIA
jgi:hypothetical protein